MTFSDKCAEKKMEGGERSKERVKDFLQLGLFQAVRARANSVSNKPKTAEVVGANEMSSYWYMRQFLGDSISCSWLEGSFKNYPQ